MRSDSVIPGCESGAGCLIPAIGPDEARALRIRKDLLSLSHLTGPDAVLRMHGATEEDMLLLAAIEDELERVKPDGR